MLCTDFVFTPSNTTPGCETWAHAQCLYGKDRAPRLAFCYDCHDTLRALAAAERQAQQAGGKPLPPVHTGRQIRLRSRVIVCRGPRGLEEGVVTMFGEGNARVHFKVRAVLWGRCVYVFVLVVCGCGCHRISHVETPRTYIHAYQKQARAGERTTAEEWLTTSSCRFLSLEQVTQVGAVQKRIFG